MRAFGIRRRPAPGTLAQTLELLDKASPRPSAHEVMIRVHASSICRDDVLIAEGTIAGGVPLGPKPTPARPVIPGMDMSGIVVAVGSQVTRWRLGDEVFGVCDARHRNGAWGQLCCAHEDHVLLKPPQWSFEAAAGVGVAAGVACAAVAAARIQPGARCLVVGASGGVGSLLVRLLVSRDIEVIGVCSARNLKLVLELGAKRVLDYTAGNIADSLEAAGASPLDAVFDCVGGRDIEAVARRVLGRSGAFVTTVGPVYFVGDAPLGISGVMGYFAYLLGRTLWSRVRGPRYVIVGPTKTTYRTLVPEVVEKGLLPAVDRVIPFAIDAMRDAFRHVVSHRTRGRVIVQNGQYHPEPPIAPYAVLVLGPTGAVGRALLSKLMLTPACKRITAISRQPIPAHPKVQNLVWPDFSDMLLKDETAALEAFRSHDVIFCCLGASRADTINLLFRPKKYAPLFRLIDHTFVVRAAAIAQKASVSHFAMVSAMRAAPSSQFIYLQIKGEAERDLAALPLHSLSIFRPSQLMRQDGPLWERASLRLFRLLDRFLSAAYKGVWVDEVAEAMIAEFHQRRLREDGGVSTFNSDSILRLAGRLPTTPLLQAPPCQ